MKKKNGFQKGFRRWVATGGLLTVLLLGGCGGDSYTSAAGDYMEAAPQSASASVEEYVASEMSDIYREADSLGGGASGIEVNGPQTTNRKLIRNISLEVETQDFQTLVANVTARVKGLGGYVENSNIYNGSNYSGVVQRNATMTLRIPSTQTDIFLAEVADQSNITQQNENTNDVTLAYVDLESHKKVLIAERENLMDLLENATDIDAMITLEGRISDLSYQIESMESQLRTYDNKVDYSTISLHVMEVKELTEIVEPEEPTVWQRISTGFAENLNRVITTLTDLLVWFLSNLPGLALWAVIIFAIVKVAKRMAFGPAKKAASRKKKGTAKEDAASETAVQTESDKTEG